MIAVANLDEAIAGADDSEYGLSAGICSNDMWVAHRFRSSTKNSSTGTSKEQGRTAIEFYAKMTSVYLRYGDY